MCIFFKHYSTPGPSKKASTQILKGISSTSEVNLKKTVCFEPSSSLFLRKHAISIFSTSKNGVIGNIEGTVCVYPKNLEETLTILGEKGTVVIGGLAVNKILVWDFKDKQESLEQIKKEYNSEIKNVHGNGHSPLYKNFIDSIRNNCTPLIDGDEGKKSLSIILMAYKSQKYSRAINYNENLNIRSEDFEGML